MIRINLLAQKRPVRAAEERSQAWLVVIAVLLALEVAACAFLYSSLQDTLETQHGENRKLTTQIERSKARVKDHSRVKERLAQLRAREQAIAKLEKARTGPTVILLEVARILTPGRGPSVHPDKLSQVRRENPQAMFNAGWDSRRLWLTNFVEKGRSVRLEGQARDGEDVSELARRMNLSRYFSDVRLRPAKRSTDKETKLALVDFALEAKVKY